MKNINIPDEFMGIKVDEAMDRFLKRKDAPESPKATIPSNAPDRSGFVYVPSINLYVAKKRELNGLSWNKAVDKIYGSQGIEIEGAKAEMPTPLEFMSYVNYLLAGDVPNLEESERTAILDDILKIGDYRGNHLNAKFIKDANGFNKLGIETAIFDSSGKFVKKTSPLEGCLPENCYADIKSINKQGLLTKKSSNQNYEQCKNSYFWIPAKGYVAWFYASSDGALLDCYRYPDYANASLGVRLVVRPKGDAFAKK